MHCALENGSERLECIEERLNGGVLSGNGTSRSRRKEGAAATKRRIARYVMQKQEDANAVISGK